MEFSFVFNKTLSKEMEKNRMKFLDGTINIGTTKGLTCVPAGRVFVNLSAEQWKDCLTEESLIEELTKTIVHEHIHFEIETWTFTPLFHTNKGEEYVCRAMSEQPRLRHNPFPKRKL